MTPKEKAEELFGKFNFEIPTAYSINDTADEVNKKMARDVDATLSCAIIAVEEVLRELHLQAFGTRPRPNRATVQFDYWKEVLTELKSMK